MYELAGHSTSVVLQYNMAIVTGTQTLMGSQHRLLHVPQTKNVWKEQKDRSHDFYQSRTVTMSQSGTINEISALAYKLGVSITVNDLEPSLSSTVEIVSHIWIYN